MVGVSGEIIRTRVGSTAGSRWRWTEEEVSEWTTMSAFPMCAHARAASAS